MITRVFGPETATGPYKHPACLTELSNGDLYLVYYGGQGEYARDTTVFGSRLRKGETTWSAPVALARDPFRSVGNGVIWQAPDGLVWLFYVVRFGDTWGTSRIQAKVSRDMAATWSDAFPLVLEAGMMVRNRPIVLHDGSYLLPIYFEDGADTERVGPKSTSRFLRFDTKTQAWTSLGEIRSANGNIQPAVVEVAPNHLIAYSRRGGGYGPTTDGWLVRGGIHRWRPHLERGTQFRLPQPELGRRFPEALVGSAAAGLQRPHVGTQPADAGPLRRPGPDLARQARAGHGQEQLRVPDRLPGPRRPHPRGLHLGLPQGHQPRRADGGLDQGAGNELDESQNAERRTFGRWRCSDLQRSTFGVRRSSIAILPGVCPCRCAARRVEALHPVPPGGSGLKDRLVGLVGGRREARETFWALRDVGFEVPRGETLGLIGHNGCGKSTLLQIIAGILEPDGGTVSTTGRITSLLELGAGFSPDLSGRDNVFLNASLHGVPTDVIRAKFDEIVAFAELGRFIDTPVRNYSSGMYMRLGFSVAAHLDPEIVLVDEALAVGDEAFQRKCLRKIQQFQAQGVTVIIVSHDLLLVERLCARACLLQRGELVSIGPAADVISALPPDCRRQRRGRRRVPLGLARDRDPAGPPARRAGPAGDEPAHRRHADDRLRLPRGRARAAAGVRPRRLPRGRHAPDRPEHPHRRPARSPTSRATARSATRSTTSRCCPAATSSRSPPTTTTWWNRSITVSASPPSP